MITQFAFFTGLLVFKPIKLLKSGVLQFSNSNIVRIMKIFYLFSCSILLVFQIMIYVSKGIPLFAESRLNVVGDDNLLFKLFDRLKEVVYVSVILLTYYFILAGKKKTFFSFFAKIIALFLLAFSILNGSKAAFISLILIYYIFAFYYARNGHSTYLRLLKRHTGKLLGVGIVGALLVITLSEAKGINAFGFLIFRIFSSGDIFYMTFPHGVIESFVSSGNWFVNLFASPLNMLQLIDKEQVPESVGFLITEYHHGVNTHTGPTPRHNIFGYLYIGPMGAVLFSFLCGYFLGFIRNKLLVLLPNNIFSLLLYGNLLIIGIRVAGDFHYTLSGLINIIVLLVLLMFSWVLAEATKSQNRGGRNVNICSYTSL
jgi:hypothetical protein